MARASESRRETGTKRVSRSTSMFRTQHPADHLSVVLLLSPSPISRFSGTQRRVSAHVAVFTPPSPSGLCLRARCMRVAHACRVSCVPLTLLFIHLSIFLRFFSIYSPKIISSSLFLLEFSTYLCRGIQRIRKTARKRDVNFRTTTRRNVDILIQVTHIIIYVVESELTLYVRNCVRACACIYVGFRAVRSRACFQAFLSIATKVIPLNMHSLAFSGKTVKRRLDLTIIVIEATRKLGQSWLTLNDISVIVI